MKRLFAVLLIFPLFVQAAEELKDQQAAEVLARSIMEKVAGGDFKQGMEMARPYLVVSQAQFDETLSKLEQQLPLVDKRFGKSVGWEKISSKMVGESLLQLTYIQKLERHALVWRFIFYKPGTGWKLDTFHSKDSLNTLFAE